MSTLATAQRKYEDNTRNAGGAWKAGVDRGNYCQKVTEFLGGTPTSMCRNYDAGVGRVSAAEFQSAIAGKGNAWAEGLRRKIGA